jgi:hypothetical protein
VYTGADRYSLRNFKIAQHKLEFKGKNWMVRGYTTQENSGESYIAGALGAFMNEAYSPSSTWFPTYIGTFSETRRLAQGSLSDITIHNNTRALVDANSSFRVQRHLTQPRKRLGACHSTRPEALSSWTKSDLWAADGQLSVSDALG